MTVREFKDRLTEELRTKYKKDSRPTPILDRLDLHLKDFEGYDSASIINEKNIQSDVYLSMLLQICYPSRIKMDIDENYQPITKKRIAIISCKSRKQDYVCSADEMYSPSPVYRAQREFCIKGYDDYYIISSKYGIIHHTQIIEPYDIRLGHITLEAEKEIHKWDKNMLDKIDSQIKYMKSKDWDIDYHTSNIYFSPLDEGTKKMINHIKQPRGIGASTPTYTQAINLLDSEPLSRCLEFISEKKKPKYNEQPKWFYHPSHPPFFGKSRQLKLKYPDTIQEGNLIRTSNGITPQHKGWVIDKTHLDNMYQTDSGQWRIKKQK